jgi:hypothetical protein
MKFSAQSEELPIAIDLKRVITSNVDGSVDKSHYGSFSLKNG